MTVRTRSRRRRKGDGGGGGGEDPAPAAAAADGGGGGGGGDDGVVPGGRSATTNDRVDGGGGGPGSSAAARPKGKRRGGGKAAVEAAARAGEDDGVGEKVVPTRRKRKRTSPPSAATSAAAPSGRAAKGAKGKRKAAERPKRSDKSTERPKRSDKSIAKAGRGSSKLTAPAAPSSDAFAQYRDDDVTRVRTAQTCARRWAALLALRGRPPPSPLRDVRSEPLSSSDDPFDCSDLVVPPAHELVEREAELGIRRWEDLASRVIVEEEGDDGGDEAGDGAEGARNADGGDGASEGGGRAEEGGKRRQAAPPPPLRDHELLLDAASRGDKRKHRLLPPGFDWKCATGPSPSSGESGPSEDGGRHRPRVISLLDPARTQSYEEELWKVFRSVKTSDELERLCALGAPGGADGDDGTADVSHGCRHTLEVGRTVREGLAKYSRLDAHGLGRLRLRDRHPDPFGTALFSHVDGNGSSESIDESDGSTSLQTTIRFEVLRHCQNLKRGSSPDGNRMEVELHGSSHTLLDLHRLLAECSSNDSAHGDDARGEEEEEEEEGDVCPGVFFVENTFYTCGDAGDKMAEAIRRWLDGEEPEPAADEGEAEEGRKSTEETKPEATMTPRRSYLGLSPRTASVPMSSRKLEDVSLRLGVRYFHAFVPPRTPLGLRPRDWWNLANESAVYVTGIQTHVGASRHAAGDDVGPEARLPSDRPPPEGWTPIVVHDAWSQPQRHKCHACDFSMASIVTVDDPLTDAPPPGLDVEANRVRLEGTPMCVACYRALHYRPGREEEAAEGEGGRGRDALPTLQLRQRNRPGLVFDVEDFERMAAVSSLEEVVANAPF